MEVYQFTEGSGEKVYIQLDEIKRVFSENQKQKISFLSGFNTVIKRNISIIFQYKLKIVNSFLNSLIGFSMYFFISFLLPDQKIVTSSYTVSGISFIFFGLLITSYGNIILTSGLGSLSSEIRQGTFETIVLTPFGLKRYIAIEILSEVVYYSIQTFIFFIPVFFIFPFTSDVVVVTFETSLTLLALIIAYVLFMTTLTLASSLLVVVLKRGREISLAISGILHFLGGVLYPISVFPKFFQIIALASPLTQAIMAFREILFTGASLNETVIWSAILLLAIYSAITLLIFNKLYNKIYQTIQKKGSTAHY